MLKQFWSDVSANMGVMFAAAISLGFVVAAFAIDAGSLYYERRQVQAVVDLAAITAARDPLRANILAQQVLVDAGLLAPGATTGLVVTTGHYTSDSAVEIAKRFVAGQQPFNAVDVRFSKPGTVYFAQNFMAPPQISASGTASLLPEASFSLGSRILSLNGGILNSLLGKLLGTNLTLLVGDYTSLVNTKVELLNFLDALAQEMKLTVGTYNNLLDMDAPTGAIVKALKAIAPPTVKTILNKINIAGDGISVPLNQLFSIGNLGNVAIGDASAVTGLKLSLLEILGAAAKVADSDRFLNLDVSSQIEGLLSTTVYLGVGEPPNGSAWFKLGPAGTILRTAQARLYVDLKLTGGLGLLFAPIRLPIWVDIAHSQAKLIAMSCPSTASPNGTAIIDVTPGLARVGMGILNANEIRDHKIRPTARWTEMANVVGLRISGLIDLNVAKNTTTRLTFASNEIGNGTIKSAKTTNIVGSLATSILTGLRLDIDLPLLSILVPSIIEGLVKALVLPLAGLLDMIIDGLLAILGIRVGEADVQVFGVRCSTPTLIR